MRSRATATPRYPHVDPDLPGCRWGYPWQYRNVPVAPRNPDAGQLHRARHEAGLTLEQIARQLEIPKSTLARWATNPVLMPSRCAQRWLELCANR